MVNVPFEVFCICEPSIEFFWAKEVLSLVEFISEYAKRGKNKKQKQRHRRTNLVKLVVRGIQRVYVQFPRYLSLFSTKEHVEGDISGTAQRLSPPSWEHGGEQWLM